MRGSGKRDTGASLLSAAALGMLGDRGRASYAFSLLRFRRFILKGLVRGDKEVPPTFTLSGDAYSAHARRPGARARQRFCFVLMAIPSLLSGGRGWHYRCRSNLGGDAFGMHASGSGEQAREISLFCACAVFA